MQTVVDARCSLGFGKLYRSKVPMTAVDVLHKRVLSFYEEYGADINMRSPTTGANFARNPAASL